METFVTIGLVSVAGIATLFVAARFAVSRLFPQETK
jgi:hypothetical protein